LLRIASNLPMLEKIFSRSKKKTERENEPDICFGRYSDNNKTVEKVEKWNEAEALFKQKKYLESIASFFDYLRDDAEENVYHEQVDGKGSFYFFQGSQVIRGKYEANNLEAEAHLALMPQPSVPVMRRLLEMNFNLYYSRYAMNEDKISILFNSDIQTANPGKLYYALKEMATKADKLDDLLLSDFATLQPCDADHIAEIPDAEKQIKLEYMKKWIKDTLELIESVDADKYSGGIAYLLLALAYRIDYLIVPEGRLLLELEKIVEIYFRKDDRLVMQKNLDMMECYQKLALKEKEEFFPYLFRSRFTFSIVTPQNYKSIADAIYNANQNIGWYKDNKFPKIAAQISEYGFSYCQYSYSLPKPVSELFHIFMRVNYSDYFRALGFTDELYNHETSVFDKEKITERINHVIEKWKPKYPELNFSLEKLKFDNQVAFNQSYTTEIEYLNLETK
jgi:hypothetical protein